MQHTKEAVIVGVLGNQAMLLKCCWMHAKRNRIHNSGSLETNSCYQHVAECMQNTTGHWPPATRLPQELFGQSINRSQNAKTPSFIMRILCGYYAECRSFRIRRIAAGWAQVLGGQAMLLKWCWMQAKHNRIGDSGSPRRPCHATKMLLSACKTR